MSYSYLNIPKNSSLPIDWKPSRGKGRIKQKSKMTKEQIEEERKLRLEKNRLSATNSRRKKKINQKNLLKL